MNDHRDLQRYRIGIAVGIILMLITYPLLGQTKAEVWNYIKATDIKHKEIVYAQAMLETGHLTSTIYKENNNLFGMKTPTQRQTFAIGENRGHAVYLNWRYSVIEYAYWQSLYYDDGDYYEFLKRVGYATSKTYINKLKSITKQ